MERNKTGGNGSWEQFKPGNQAHLVHGADSPRTIASRAEQERPALLEVAPHLAEPAYRLIVEELLAVLAQSRLINEHIARVCETQGAGKVPIRLWEASTAKSRLLVQLLDSVGLAPLGRARLLAATAGAEMATVTLADMTAEGAEIRRRAQARLAETAETPLLGPPAANALPPVSSEDLGSVDE